MPDPNPELAKAAPANAGGPVENGASSPPLPAKDFIYQDDLDYLEDVRLLLYEGRKERRAPYPSPLDNRDFQIHWEQIQEKKIATRRLARGLRMDNLVIDFELDDLQELILAGLAVEQLIGNRVLMDMNEFVKIIAGENLRTVINARHALEELKRKRLVFDNDHRHSHGEGLLDKDVLNYLAEGKPILAGKFRKEPRSKPKLADVIKKLATKFPSPQSLYDELEKHVVGQEKAKMTLSVAAFNHLRRIRDPRGSREGIKPNVMLAGPTGCGKTHLVKTLASVLGLPCVIGDATCWTEAGYVGSDYDAILYELYEKAGSDLAFAQCGIVFVDEVDKIAGEVVAGANRDVGGEGVQRAMLKALEGSVVTMTKRGVHAFASSQKEIDTTTILFILGGAFDGIEKIIERRAKSRPIGFWPAKSCPTSADLTKDDLIAYGMLREFVGRIPVLARINPLTGNELVEILTRPEQGLIAEINRACEPCGLRFEFTPAAVRQMAEKALEEGTGARSLRGVINTLIEPHVFEHSKAKPAGVRVVEITA